MTESHQPTGVSRQAKIVMVTVFLIGLWLPTLDSAFHWDQAAQVHENRLAAPFPRFSPGLAGVREFLAGLERYFNDHFGFRQRLIHWSQTWQRAWFKQTWVSRVIIGRDGWLYGAWTADPVLDHQSRTTAFTAARLREWQRLFECRRDWLRQRGIHHLVIIPPDKRTAYPAHLPE
jgi:alginate O-acetyltransferase complex protein AlgJ